MYRFVKAQHLRRPKEFELVYRHKQKVADGLLLIFARRRTSTDSRTGENNSEGEDLSMTRLGLSVSKRRGNAVHRNREKRLIREAFRLTQHERPQGLDLIVVPIATTPLSLEQVKQSLVKLTHKLDRRLPAVSASIATASEVLRDGEVKTVVEETKSQEGSSR